MGHRVAAGILFIWTIMFFVKVIKHYRNSNVMYYGWMITVGLLTFQVIFGALVIFTLLNLGIALLHALFITCYFGMRSEEHTSELQSRGHLVCRLLLEK